MSDAIRQALVAIGGRARRLRRCGVDVEVSKSFLSCGATSLLDLCLWSLAEAGIEEVVLAHHTDEQRERAEALLDPGRHPAVLWFRDAGVGVHGIPFQALDVLDPVYLFEAGHGVAEPAHHRRLVEAKSDGNVVFSAFRPAEGNPRFQVTEPRPDRAPRTWALAQPMVVDRQWAVTVAERGFEVDPAAASYASRGALTWVAGEMPVEFDLYGEYRRARNKLEANLAGSGSTPWSVAPGAEPVTELFEVPLLA